MSKINKPGSPGDSQFSPALAEIVNLPLTGVTEMPRADAGTRPGWVGAAARLRARQV